MGLLIGFAFLAGVVTILSPCILPVLPIVLSGSVATGRRRPWGIVIGFILSFTFFTLFLSAIVKATGLSADALRTFAVVVIFFLGVSMLVPAVQVGLEKLFSKLSSKLPTGQTSTGFGGGMVTGVTLGLIWTPCVGPILAAVISLALTGAVNGTAVVITLSYALGTAIPMLAILYGGRALLQKTPGLLRHAGTVQKVFGVLMILTALALHFNIDRKFQTYILETFPNYGVGLTQFEDSEAVQTQLDSLQGQDDATPESTSADEAELAPELIPGGEWFNTEPLTLESLRGKVVLMDFWTYTCINCIRTLPYLVDWHATYADDGFVIIGVHTPEFEFEKDPDNVAEAIADFGIEYPVMQDNDYATWRAYNNRYWPAKYLIDANGVIRYTHFGEGDYDETEGWIQTLLGDAGATVDATIDNPDYSLTSRTPELYLGYDRIEALASPEEIQSDEAAPYTQPETLPLHSFAYDGLWTLGPEQAAPEAGATLTLHFEAQKVFLVMRPTTSEPSTVRVSLDGEVLHKALVIDTDRLYTLVELDESGEHGLQLEFLDGNLELFAFTFG